MREPPTVKKQQVPNTPPKTTFKANDHSQKLFETRKLTKMKEIFTLLDSDCDGLISKDAMEIDNIPEIAYGILKPILIELEEREETWDFERFV